jgi:orotidine-5'-phosphate decarboxylase
VPAPEAPLHERLAALVDGLSGRLLGEGGLSGLGAVVGATEPEHIARLREMMPRSVFLLPGVGAQGGDPALLGAAFAPGPAGAIVSSSRGIAGAEDPAAAAEELRATLWEISGA